MSVPRKAVMIRIILGKLAQCEGNVLKLYLGIYFSQEGGMGQGYTVTILFPPPRDTKIHLPDHSPPHHIQL